MGGVCTSSSKSSSEFKDDSYHSERTEDTRLSKSRRTLTTEGSRQGSDRNVGARPNYGKRPKTERPSALRNWRKETLEKLHERDAEYQRAKNMEWTSAEVQEYARLEMQENKFRKLAGSVLSSPSNNSMPQITNMIMWLGLQCEAYDGQIAICQTVQERAAEELSTL